MNWEEFCMKCEEFLTNWTEFSIIHTGKISSQNLNPNCVTGVCQRSKPIMESDGGWKNILGKNYSPIGKNFGQKGKNFMF